MPPPPISACEAIGAAVSAHLLSVYSLFFPRCSKPIVENSILNDQIEQNGKNKEQHEVYYGDSTPCVERSPKASESNPKINNDENHQNDQMNTEIESERESSKAPELNPSGKNKEQHEVYYGDSTPCVESSSKASESNSKSKGKNEEQHEMDMEITDTKGSNVANSSKASRSNSEGGDENAPRKLMSFKQFDILEDCSSDHHYINQTLVGNQQSLSWTKRIQEEWRILQDNLPETIFVRAYESRMDLLRVAIIGADGTPYHDGLFFFDIMFPSSYPHNPPKVYYRSGGLRLNPNLYETGKVCLSLLGTWSGSGTERWLPEKSTMLQVLLSIQALILNSNPFFNEPGFDKFYRNKEGEKKSKSYNKDVFILSIKTMVYSMNNPPKHFEDLVADHFRARAYDILKACRAYWEGAKVGSEIRSIVKKAEKVEGGKSTAFKSSLVGMVGVLAKALCKSGAILDDEYNYITQFCKTILNLPRQPQKLSW